MQAALDLLRGCDCDADEGCPACTQLQSCAAYNFGLSRRGGAAVLATLLAGWPSGAEAATNVNAGGDAGA